MDRASELPMQPQQSALPQPPSLKKALQGALESKHHRTRSFSDYRRFITAHYDGLAGKLTRISGLISGHEALAGQVFKPSAFCIRGCKRILDAGCGDGRYTRHILKRADDDALITAFDLSQRMLVRAARRLKNPRVRHVSADLTRLPYPD